MSRFQVTVLYEDSRSGTNQFGLHYLVLTYVAERLGCDRWQLGKTGVAGNPRNGNDKVLESCWRDIQAIHSPMVIAVLDNDRIRVASRLADTLTPSSSDEEVIARIHRDCPEPARLRVILLKENMETVLRQAGECDPTLSVEYLERALRKKPLERDAILNSIATDPQKGTVRECIWGKNESLRLLVDSIVTAFQAGLPPKPVPLPAH